MPPTTAKPQDKGSINLRKAKAGQLLLENPARSLGSALEEAGYAQATARVPKRNNLSADQCVQEAIKQSPGIDPSGLLEAARAALSDYLRDPERTGQARLGELSRAVEVCERWFGGHERAAGEVEQFVDRLEFMGAVNAELERRLEAKAVDAVEVETPKAPPNEASPQQASKHQGPPTAD